MSTTEPPAAAPGESQTPNLFKDAKAAVVSAEGAHAPGAWRGLMYALGHSLQGGMHRAEQSRRRIARGV